MSENAVQCSNCRIFACCTSNVLNGPKNCPTKLYKEQIGQAEKLYHDDPEMQKMIVASDNTQVRGALKWTRVESTIDFARQMGYKKIGIAFCAGLLFEANTMTKILTANGFEVESVCCKCGGISKDSVGVTEGKENNALLRDDFGYTKRGFGDSSCNPIGQALVANERGTDFNIIVGLCVGHDTLFIRHSKAPVTVLVAKDGRLLHNPAAALNSTTFYFKYLLSPVTLR